MLLIPINKYRLKAYLKAYIFLKGFFSFCDECCPNKTIKKQTKIIK